MLSQLFPSYMHYLYHAAHGCAYHAVALSLESLWRLDDYNLAAEVCCTWSCSLSARCVFSVSLLRCCWV